MAQPSIAAYFNTRKRTATEDTRVLRAKKVLVLDSSVNHPNTKGFDVDTNVVLQKEVNIKDVPSKSKEKIQIRADKILLPNKIVPSEGVKEVKTKRVVRSTRRNPVKEDKNQQNIQKFLVNMAKTESSKMSQETVLDTEAVDIRRHITPPSTPSKKINAMDKIKVGAADPSIKEIRQKLSRSHRLAELKASLKRFNEGADKLKEIEKKTVNIPESPRLKNFKSIELEVHLSPQKFQSPEKAYLSPKKDFTARKNLLSLLSPTKNAVALPESPSKRILDFTSKPALTLPVKYRFLAEMFRSIDTVCQILYNRKEVITFRKVKPAVEEMLKRNLTERHLSQIKHIYPDAYEYSAEKLRQFGTGKREEKYELLIKPKIEEDNMTADVLLNRRRKLFDILINQVKEYHDEFLKTLEPPMHIPKEKITRWHPEFDIERVPDIAQDALPQPPEENRMTTGKDVLEKARQMFNCNTRMEQALERLKQAKTAQPEPPKMEEEAPSGVLKGIPKALLEKVRQKQAAKAMLSMTRSVDKDKELQMYSRLPELARLTRNLFVSEKKSVLSLDVVVDKLGNSYRFHLTKTEMEDHLKIIAKEVPGWLVLHNIRNTDFLKLAKDADLSLVLAKLETLTKQKSES